MQCVYYSTPLLIAQIQVQYFSEILHYNAGKYETADNVFLQYTEKQH